MPTVLIFIFKDTKQINLRQQQQNVFDHFSASLFKIEQLFITSSSVTSKVIAN